MLSGQPSAESPLSCMEEAEKGEGIEQRTNERRVDTDRRVVVARGRGWRRGEGAKGGNGMDGDLTWGGEHTIQYTGDVV